MTYTKRLNLAKFLMMLTAGLCLVPAMISGIWDQAQIFWIICLPIIAFLLWGSLHGTGRSVRMAGYLGLAYLASSVLSGNVFGLLEWILMAGFIAACGISIRRTETATATP